jgi:Fe-S-cluster-containing dehydrogenase component
MNKKRIDLDLDRCVGCYACVIACLDQNYDIDEECTSFRRVVKMEDTEKGSIQSISIACMHCEDNPCIFACPTGALYKDMETELVQVDQSKCIGCHSCLLACPYGAPKFNENNKMSKCTGCNERVKNGLMPACVMVCPTKALKFETSEESSNDKIKRKLRKVLE